MLILLNSYGQRSNILFQHINLHSFCYEHNIYFYNKYVHKLSKQYPNLKGDNHFINLLIFLRIPQILNRLRITKYLNFDDVRESENYRKIIRTANVVTCDGWFFRNKETVLKHRSLYQHLFKPNVDENRLNYQYLNKKTENEKIIGLHIRRGDYKDHENGIYYYTDDVYITNIKLIVDNVEKAGNSVKVIIFTNDECLNFALYQSVLNNPMLSRESVLEDHYLMSKCDYLIGAPSTFTRWASYIGEVPCCHIYNIEFKASISDFCVFDGFLG